MTTRKEFIAGTSIGAFAQTALPLPATPAGAPTPAAVNADRVQIGGDLPFVFERGAFEAILDRPAQHRQCFGARKINGGEVISAMANSGRVYDDDFKEGAGSMHAVAVLYHGSAIGLALSSSVWEDLLVPFLAKNPDLAKEVPEAKKGAGNPYLTDKWLTGAVKLRGSSFFVCHNAITGFSQGIAAALKMPAKEAHKRIMEGIVPGALAVPAGVMAINACQEAHFTYIATS